MSLSDNERGRPRQESGPVYSSPNSSVKTTPTVCGIVQVDISSAVDDLGFIDGRSAVAILPAPVMRGVTVWLNIGHGRTVLNDLGALISHLRPAGTVAVIGFDPAGIGEVHRRLSVAFASGGGA